MTRLSIRSIDTRVKAFFGALLVAFLVALLFSGSAWAAPVSAKLKKSLTDKSVKVRIAAVVAVGKAKAPESRELLERMLYDSEPAVRAAAIEALGDLGDPASLPALASFAADPTPMVGDIAKRTVTLLEARRERVDLSDVGDQSGVSYGAGLATKLQEVVGETLKKDGGASYLVENGGVQKGWLLGLKIRGVKQVQQGAATLVEVKCDMTVAELPGKILRLASSATTAAGIEGKVSPRMEEELAKDAIGACGPALVKDYLDYMKKRPKA